MNDRLVADLRARRPEALEELLHQHGSEIHAVAYLVLRNPADAEEVTADTLLMAWRKIDALRDPERLRPWLLRTATRLALRRRSRRAVPWTVPLDEALEVSDRSAPAVDRLAISQALDRLPPRMRAVIALHHIAGLSVADTAEAVGRSPNTVKSQLREALSRLRADLTDETGPQPTRTLRVPHEQ